MKRLIQRALGGVFLLAGLSIATAQQEPQPVVRLGNFLEVGNDVWMHILATGDIRYRTTENWDFENRVRDRVNARNPNTSVPQAGEGDINWTLLRFGVDFKYQKSLTLHLTGEQRVNLDGNQTDDRSNSANPGGVDVFGRAANTENAGYHFKYAYIDYKFIGTPLRMRVGFDLWQVDQAGYVGDNDPRFALFGDFGNFDVMAAAVVETESQRIGLTNDNDLIYYTFSFGYSLKPHRFQVDVVYNRDRFSGADTAAQPNQGQKQDTVLIMTSWTGTVGPVRGLLQGALLTGRDHGGVTRIPAGVPPGRAYDVFAGSVIGYGEVNLGVVRPFLLGLFATGDGDPTDRKLHGFNPYSSSTTGLITGTGYLAHMDTSEAFARDYSCPGRFQGFSVGGGVPGIPGRTATGAGVDPRHIGVGVLQATASNGFTECTHTVSAPFNDRIGQNSHAGIVTPYSNPGTIVGAVGLRVFPLKGHEINGWYVYKGMVNAKLLNVAFAPERAARGMGGIHTTQWHEIGGHWLWTLNPNFDIRLLGNIGIAGEGFKDLAHLANCSPGGAITGSYATTAQCGGKNLALTSEVRFRARF
jgi:hypothetical protein